MFKPQGALMSATAPVEESPGPGEGGKPPVATVVVAPPVQQAPVDPDWLNPRLDQARTAARTDLLKSLGYTKPEEVQQQLEKLKALEQSQLTDQEKANARLKELEPLAGRTTLLEATVKGYADRELASLSDAQRLAVVAVAGDDSSRVLSVIEQLRPTWAAVAPVVTPAPKPATTAAPGGPPPANGESPVDHKSEYQALLKTNPFAAARYYEQHGKAIT